MFAGVQKCAGTDHQLRLRDVLPPAPGPAHPVHLWPHGVLTEHQWPHRLCHSGVCLFFFQPPSLTVASFKSITGRYCRCSCSFWMSWVWWKPSCCSSRPVWSGATPPACVCASWPCWGGTTPASSSTLSRRRRSSTGRDASKISASCLSANLVQNDKNYRFHAWLLIMRELMFSVVVF